MFTFTANKQKIKLTFLSDIKTKQKGQNFQVNAFLEIPKMSWSLIITNLYEFLLTQILKYRLFRIQIHLRFPIYSHGMKFRHFVEIITKTIPLRLISLSKPNVVWACYLVEIYSLTIQLQILGLGINN